MVERNDKFDLLILASAKKEFLSYGFKGASLRRICAACGLTTGVIYKRYASKDELFSRIVTDGLSDSEMFMRHLMRKYYESFSNKDVNLFIQAMKEEIRYYLDVIYNNYDTCILLFLKSGGSALSNDLAKALDKRIEESIQCFINAGGSYYDADGIRILMQLQVLYFKEILAHGYKKDKAISTIKVLEDFMESGWRNIFLKMVNQEKYNDEF